MYLFPFLLALVSLTACTAVTLQFGTSLDTLSNTTLEFEHDGVHVFEFYVQFSEPVHLFDDWAIVASTKGAHFSVTQIDDVTQQLAVTVELRGDYKIRLNGAFVISQIDNTAVTENYRIVVNWPQAPFNLHPSFSGSSSGEATPTKSSPDSSRNNLPV